MKSIVTLFSLILITLHSVGQVNLVPNPSFEDTSSCPTQLNQVYKAIGWISFGNSPDFFHSCNSLYNFALGYQSPRTGNAYAGLALLLYGNPNREFIGIRLNDSLNIGQTYFVSFYVSCANGSSASLSSNNQGALFSTISYDSLNLPPINNYSNITNFNIITDSTNWIQVKGSFIADSNYKYICLGNFYSNQNTDTIRFPFGNTNSNSNSYYFLDDICVSEDSITCYLADDIAEQSEPKIVLFPNPNDGSFFVNLNFPSISIAIYNCLGQTIPFKSYIDNGFTKINILNSHSGIYYIKIANNEFIYKEKIFISNDY